MNETWAKKSLGQHFLVDENISRKIVGALDIGHSDTVLEIGPGPGALTRHLVAAAPGKLLVIEKDERFAKKAREEFFAELAGTDAVDFDWKALEPEGRSCKVCGNLPYNVASRIMWDFAAQARYERAVFMVQHEVALRVAASPGGKTYGGLSVWLQNFAAIRYLFKVPPHVFRPRPKVDSAVIRFAPLSEEERPSDPQGLALVVRQAFQNRRKQLKKIFKKEWNPRVEEALDAIGLGANSRPEQLSPQAFQLLIKNLGKQENA